MTKLTAPAALVALAGCASVPAQATIDRRNQRAYDAALASAQQRFGGAPFAPAIHHLTTNPDEGPVTPAPDAPTALPTQVRGQGADDRVYRMADGNVGVAGPTCALGSACGCDLAIGYVYLQRPDGRVAVVRLQPQLTTHVREVDWCGYGCGVPAPPEPIVVANLGVDDPALVEVIEVPLRVERVVEHCDNPVPRP